MHMLNNNLAVSFLSLAITCKSDPVCLSKHTLLTHFPGIGLLVFPFLSMNLRLDECKSCPEHNFPEKF